MNVAMAALVVGILIPSVARDTDATPGCRHASRLVSSCARSRHPATADVLTRASDVAVDRLLRTPERRVRLLHPDLQAAVETGIRRSPTLLQLLQALHTSDLIVQVEFRSDRRSQRGARLMFAAATASDRYIRIQIERSAGENQLIAEIGHELFHALEVAVAPEVRSEDALAALYRRIGFRLSWREQFDTHESHLVEAAIRSELLTPACQLFPPARASTR